MAKIKNWQKEVDRKDVIQWKHRNGMRVWITPSITEIRRRNVWVVSTDFLPITSISMKSKENAMEYAMAIMKSNVNSKMLSIYEKPPMPTFWTENGTAFYVTTEVENFGEWNDWYKYDPKYIIIDRGRLHFVYRLIKLKGL